jgi:predicted helicase
MGRESSRGRQGARMTTFRQLLDQFEASAKTRTAKGRRFEEFCKSYFQVDPYWQDLFDQVWSWMDWPGRDGRTDTGVDLVAREAGTGKLWAIQCKFYSPDATLQWGHVATFSGSLGQGEFDHGLVVSTAGSVSSKVGTNLLDRHGKPAQLWQVDDFEMSRVDWDDFRIDKPAQLRLREPKRLRPHQENAVLAVEEGFELRDRGQMIMACGTGKTFTSLRLAEQMVGAGGSVLFLVPSINLLSQAVLSWANEAEVPLHTFAVCSDTKAGVRIDDEDMNLNDLSFPASTNADALVAEITARAGGSHMTVVFSTYQSIDVITQAQSMGLTMFDLIICDEAHRTTGAFKELEDQSAFTKVHDDNYVRTARRLYMTATPRVYGDQTKAKAAQSNILVASMDDEAAFGPVFHELPFGEAVHQGLLTDYKVLVLAVNEDAVSAAFQRQLATAADGELALDDVARIVGCWHGLSKRGPQFVDDDIPMRRAVAFASTIKQSKRFQQAFPEIVNVALEDRRDSNAVRIETQHVDGSHNVKVRSEAIAWLEEPPGQRVCRVLSNAKCLTEGVDVPALDAVLFLNPRKSIVDVVQAVGRVMRLSQDKEFGYVILPIGVPAGVVPEEALRDNKKYQVVWQVLQALRSHDERLAAEINKIDINKRSNKINVIGIGVAGGDEADGPGVTTTTDVHEQGTLELPDLGEWCDALYARIVEKVGDRQYMESWAADISRIAAAQEARIKALLDHPEQNPDAVARFDKFHTALQNNLNDGVTRVDTIGMLSQHLITRPVFEALFGGDEFTHRNPVSQVMQGMIDSLDAANLQSETATLEGFYNHIRMLIGGIDTAEGRQRVITELYEKFFKKALPKTADSLGIVYTPIEIVDFINRAVDDLLREHFGGISLSDEGVHVLDPFAGTGTFIARMLQSGLIHQHDLERKYRAELHANEIMLLAYYIAAINIETIYDALSSGEYRPFDGIVLTDTFQLAELGDPMDEVFFPRNNERADRQKGLDIRVIVGNPPYSVGQAAQSDRNANVSYSELDESIRQSFVARSTGNPRSLYDSYLRAIRWAMNRIRQSPHGGVVAFVTNGGWLDGKAADGVRRSLADELTSIYVVNLRGNAALSGEARRKEGDNVFGEGSKSLVAVTLLVYDPAQEANVSTVRYWNIGDYLSRADKLDLLSNLNVSDIPWEVVDPGPHADWVAARNPHFAALMPLTGDDGVFVTTSLGLVSARDSWVFGSDRDGVKANVRRMIDTYNSEVERFYEFGPSLASTAKERANQVKGFVKQDPTRFQWNLGDFARAAQRTHYQWSDTMLRDSMYRPFFRQHLAFDPTLARTTGQLPLIYPAPASRTVSIALTNAGSRSPFGVLAVDCIPSVHLIGSDITALLPRTVASTQRKESPTLFASPRNVTNINPAALLRMRERYGPDLDEDAVFAYVYGILHSPDFRLAFAVNLRKEAPRIPLVSSRADFDAFASAGRELLGLHLGYETVDPYPLVEEWVNQADPQADPSVLLVGTRRMAYPKVADPHSVRKVADRTRLLYNPHLTLSGIPPRAHDYIIGTRSAIDWIVDRYYVKTDTASGIVNDPNRWGLERGEPRYIVDLVKRVVTVSVRTVDVVDALPRLAF